MPTNRTYGDGCGIARALDVVGERWALLIVRELLFGPQRFSDLRHALPGASANVLADRLRELEAHGVVARRVLPPPAASRVYELTERGRALEPVLLALGEWGVVEPLPPQPVSISPGSVLIYLRSVGRPDPALPVTSYCVELDGRVWTVTAAAGSLHVTPGTSGVSAASLSTDPATLSALIDAPGELDTAVADGRVRVDGEVEALRALLTNTLIAA